MERDDIANEGDPVRISVYDVRKRVVDSVHFKIVFF